MQHIAILLVAAVVLAAQAPKSFVGTVVGLRPATAEVEIRPDSGDTVAARFTADTLAQKIAPGARDLKSAQAAKVTDVAAGDRVLVTLEPGGANVLRIVIMPAGDIVKRNEADRLDWQKRGVAGIVSARTGTRITVTTRTMTGSTDAVITVDDHTAFRRYAPDSVRFADAMPSRLSEVAVGDQLRARGEKSEDGLKVTAQEVVFGTFVVKAGSITAIDPAARQITLKELNTNRLLRVVLTADSQIKELPAFPGAMGGGAGRGAAGMSGPPGGTRGGPGGAMDINQMLEHIPAATVEDLKPGSTVIVSSTKGATTDQLTAIMLLANADTLIRMASASSGGNRGGGGQGAPGGMGGGMQGGMSGGDIGLSGLGLSGMVMQ